MLLQEISLNTVKHKSPNQIGAGVQGRAFKTSKPNQVRKVYGLDSLQDPYYQYIKMIEQHQDNPFFPRIYRHVVYKTPILHTSRIMYNMTGVVMMEKLIPLEGSVISKDMIITMFHNLGVEISHMHDLYAIFENKRTIQQVINTTTNDTFADALRILISSGRNSYDLHAGNWMIRLTSVGPQIVILDPVYGSDMNTITM